MLSVLEFQGLGFQGLGFRVSGFRVSGVRVSVLVFLMLPCRGIGFLDSLAGLVPFAFDFEVDGVSGF